MSNEKTYSFDFVETVIQLEGSISRDFKEKFFEWCDKTDRSGIDSWRDYIIEAATTFEEYTKDIDWNRDPPTDYITAIEEFASMLCINELGAPMPGKNEFIVKIRTGHNWSEKENNAFIEIYEYIKLSDGNSDESFRRELAENYVRVRDACEKADVEVWLSNDSGEEGIELNFQSNHAPLNVDTAVFIPCMGSYEADAVALNAVLKSVLTGCSMFSNNSENKGE